MTTIRLDGVVGWEINAADMSARLEGAEDVTLIINSGGGDIIEGFAVYNAIKAHKGKVVAQIDFAGSMASVIAMAADERTMKDSTSIMMTHRPWGGASGNSEELRQVADTLDNLEEMLVNVYSAASGKSADDMKDFLSTEKYLNAEEAKENGLIDTIESSQGDLAMVAMAGMKANAKVGFDLSAFCAKIEEMKASKPVIKNAFDNCDSLREVERVIRNEYKLSQSASTAIVGAVKKHVRSECDSPASENNELEASELRELFNSIKFGE